MGALKDLQELHNKTNREKYPNVPDHCRAESRFSDTTANGLTKAVLKWLELNGYWASRITSSGRVIGGEQVVDVIGRTRVMAGKYIPGTVKRGTADIHAVINGRHVSIEVKIGRDKLSDAQHKTKKAIELSGGIYWVVKTFDQFMVHYKEHLSNQTINNHVSKQSNSIG